MLALIDSDFASPDTRKRAALKQAVLANGAGIKVKNGPWIIGSDEPLATFCRRLNATLRPQDKVLAVPVAEGAIATPKRNPKGATIPKLRKANRTRRQRKKVVAIACNLNDAVKRDYTRIQEAVEDLGPYVRPVQALWFVETKLSSTEVHTWMDKQARLLEQDDLMVVEVSATGGGDALNLDPADENWLRQHKVL